MALQLPALTYLLLACFCPSVTRYLSVPHLTQGSSWCHGRHAGSSPGLSAHATAMSHAHLGVCSLCMCVYLCLSVCTCVCTYVCVHLWQQQLTLPV